MIERLRRFLHDKFGWGYPNYVDAGSFVMPTYGCRFCDQAVTMDSQGNWFHLPRRAGGSGGPMTPRYVEEH